MRGKFLSLTMVLLLMLMVGCSKKEESSSMDNSTASAKSEISEGTRESITPGNNGAKVGTSGTTDTASSTNKSTVVQEKIIYTGDIQIIVEDLKLSATEIRGKIDELGGYVESERLTDANSYSKARVPSEELQTFIEYLEKKYEVKSKNISTQNVTDAYVDNEARIKNLKAQEAQVLEIMKRANTVDEVLKVQSELSKVRGEIESLESRKKVWDKNVEFSTISINANLKSTAVETKLKALSGSEFGKAIGNGFKRSTTALILFFQNIIVFFISNIIIFTILGVLVFFAFKSYKKNHKK